MGFGEFLGSAMGTLAAKGQEMMEYKGEYEHLTDRALKEEFKHLRRSSASSKEKLLRQMAVLSILKDRGYDTSGMKI